VFVVAMGSCSCPERWIAPLLQRDRPNPKRVRKQTKKAAKRKRLVNPGREPVDFTSDTLFSTLLPEGKAPCDRKL